MAEETIESGGVRIQLASSPAGHRVTMAGEIDERADLVGFAARLDRRVTIDLEHIGFINSVGVREWVRMLRDLFERDIDVTLSRCSEAMVQQINMIVEAKGAARVESLFGPYECDACGKQVSMCIEVTGNEDALRAGRAPAIACPECGGAMEFIELAERYFLFLDDTE